jgi:phosphopantothenoylcysteine decarboxylase/phosphopantothenate--cysteine ligase
VLKGRSILFGITGSIAAYKSADVVRRLVEQGAEVNVVMTDASTRFATPYLFETITGRPVHTDLFEDPFSHINLSKDAGLFIIAPATANTINKISAGIADNLLTNLWLTYKGPVLIAPAMNTRMYDNPVLKRNIRELSKMGVQLIGPVTGSLACGEEGEGRMSDTGEIIDAVIAVLTDKDLAGEKLLVTAGPTREPIDAVRFISNRSSGKMGYAIAEAANRRGADVILVSGPSAEMPAGGIKCIEVETASEMKMAVEKNLAWATSVIMTAAVSDFTARKKHREKLKKTDINTLELKKTDDILKTISLKKGKRVIVGFAAESGRNIANARKKMKDKKLDLIVLNDISSKGAGFDVDTNIVTIIGKKGDLADYPVMKKTEVANVILDRMVELKKERK